MSLRPPVVVSAACASCRRALELVCEGLPAYPGYPTFHEFHCPQCRKRNYERTPGAILEVRAAAAQNAA